MRCSVSELVDMICVAGCIVVAGLLSSMVARAFVLSLLLFDWFLLLSLLFCAHCCTDRVSSIGESPPGILVKMCDRLRQTETQGQFGHTPAKGIINELCFEVSLNIARTVSP